jgi:hypothetical protein
MMAAVAGSSFGVILLGSVTALLWFAGRHGRNLPPRLHPWAYRLLAFGMFTGGAAVAESPLGGILVGWEAGLLSVAGPVSTGTGHEIVVIGGFALFLAAVLGAWLEPGPKVAWFALALPFAAALSGGHLHGVLTVLPVQQWAAQVSQWIGG